MRLGGLCGCCARRLRGQGRAARPGHPQLRGCADWRRSAGEGRLSRPGDRLGRSTTSGHSDEVPWAWMHAPGLSRELAKVCWTSIPTFYQDQIPLCSQRRRTFMGFRKLGRSAAGGLRPPIRLTGHARGTNFRARPGTGPRRCAAPPRWEFGRPGGGRRRNRGDPWCTSRCASA